MRKPFVQSRIREKAKEIKSRITTISIAFRHPDLGILPKVLAFLTLAYALSPIDLIPDFIPILGLLDDLVILPLLIFLTVKAIPDEVLQEAQFAAESREDPPGKRWTLVPLIITVWVVLAVLLTRFIIIRIRTV